MTLEKWGDLPWPCHDPTRQLTARYFLYAQHRHPWYYATSQPPRHAGSDTRGASELTVTSRCVLRTAHRVGRDRWLSAVALQQDKCYCMLTSYSKCREQSLWKLTIARLVSPAFCRPGRFVHLRIHNCPPLVTILSQVNPVHSYQHSLFKINFNNILQSTPECSERCLSLRLCKQNYVHVSHIPLACYIPCQSNRYQFDHTNNIL
jgi:hypothetical protein